MTTQHRDIEFMKDIDARFQEASGLKDRRFYSIFYSRVHPAPVMVIGIKPGGRTDGTHQLASHAFYEDWSHEYVDMNYRIAAVMRPALMTALETADPTTLRFVPKTNTFFQRAVGTDDFTTEELNANVVLCAPFVREIVEHVRPKAIVLEGLAARNNLVKQFSVLPHLDAAATVTGMRRGRLSRFFQKEHVHLGSLGHEVTLLTLGHPSHFGDLATWPAAIDALRRSLGVKFQPTKEGSQQIQQRATTEPPLHQAPSTASSTITRATTVHKEASVPSKTSQPSPANRQRPATPETMYEALRRPPSSFGYQPIHDFWQELAKLGPTSVRGLYTRMNQLGWNRPSGKPLTLKVMQIDLVSMAKHGFARRLSD